MKSFVAVFLCAFLFGCGTTKESAEVMNSRFLGKNLDDFVLKYGVPIKQHRLNSGDLIYVWNSGVVSYGIPATTTTTGTAANGFYQGNSVTSGGGSIDVFCEVQILTSPDGTIKSLTPIKDTIGAWNASRCAEIFK